MSKKRKIHDPYREREAQKYPQPIPSREYILDYLKERGEPVAWKELVAALSLQSDDELEALRRRLRAMERDGQLMTNRRGSFCLIDKVQLIPGRVMGHRDGFGFLIPDDKSGDLFLSSWQMRTVFHGDRILARVADIDKKGRREGTVVEILERAVHHIVGRFYVEDGVGFVDPENKRICHEIIIPPKEEGEAKTGQIVIVEITHYPTARAQARGRVTEVLGDHMAPGLEIDIAMNSHDLPSVWPETVLAEIKSLKALKKIEITSDRQDVRNLPLITIDGEDAKDFDDAVYCEPHAGGGWKLYVAIADVSHYVKPGSALDQEAHLRGNSVYFPGRVIPMLPEILSNELCSLKPKVDRLCMVCEMVITPAGELDRYHFYPAVMHSRARLTYTEVAQVLEGKSNTIGKRTPEIIPHLQELRRLFDALHANRITRGAIDFDTVETRVIFGAQRKIKEIIPVQRNVAHRIIEECMLVANVSAAQFIEKHKVPLLYRVHEGPTSGKLADLHNFLKEFNLGLRGGDNPQSKDYSEIIESIQARPEKHLIQTVLLRSLSQAMYAPENTGHFGLAYESYTHFTSPIRRYPDLLIHRAIRLALHQAAKKEYPYDEPALVHLGEHCSMTERRADDATRDAMDWLKCEFVMDKVGEEFEGIIASVTNFGIFVELQEIYVDGLVHVTALKNDYYQYDAAHHRLRGERTGTTYRIGDRVRVKVVRVDLDDRNIDLELVQETSRKKKSKRR